MFDTEVYTGSQCGKSLSGWSCPPDGGCPGGDCSGDWQAFVREHNIYRCMHDTTPIVWSEAVYKDALQTSLDRLLALRIDKHRTLSTVRC